jgi:dipeptidyl aminopeptidase/acylaminoacyl peptidase
LLGLPTAQGASRPEVFTLRESVAAHESMKMDLLVTSQGRVVVWSDGGNAFVARAPDYAPRQLTSYGAGEGARLLALAPDGRSLVYVRGNKQPPFSPHPATDARELWRMDLDTGKSQQIASGADVPNDPIAFSADGNAFAFSAGAMLWEFRRQGGEWTLRALLKNDAQHYAAIRLTDLVYSPDGSRLAFTSKRKAGQSYVGVVELATLECRYLALEIFQDAMPAWSPDSRQLVFVRVPGNWTMAYRFSPQSPVPWSLQRVDVRSGEVRLLWRAEEGAGAAPPPDLQAPLWTRNGDILFLWERDGWQRLYAVAADGGQPRLLTPGEGEVKRVVLNAAGDKVAFESNVGDLARSHVYRLALPGGRPERVAQGAGVETSPGFTADGGLAYIANVNGRMPNRRMLAIDGRAVVLTPSVQQQETHRRVWDKFVDVEVLPIRAEDGITSYHLLMVPAGQPPAGGYPVIVTSKGGPTGRVLPGHGYGLYTPFAQYAVSRGYIVLEINYRGGNGFGLDYRYPAQRGATGGSEVKDLAALTRYLKSRPDVNPKRIGIAGHSYGGHIVGLALSRLPQDFAAGIHMSGVADWVIEMKKDGETADWPSAPPPFIPLSERVRIEDLAHASSSTASVDQWRAPTLFIMGEADTSGHMESVIDLGNRLMERAVATEYYVVPDAGHSGAPVFPLQKMFDFFERM